MSNIVVHDLSKSDGQVVVVYYCYPETPSWSYWIVPGTLSL